MKAQERSLSDWLQDIEANAAKIVAHTVDLALEEFIAREPVGDLVITKLQNMGEAARYIAAFFPDFAAATPLPLGEMRMMRNRLAHGYFNISLGIVWRAAQDDVPDVLARVRRALEERAA